MGQDTKSHAVRVGTRFERGQLILAPFKGRDVLWTVIKVKPNGKR